jgi:hypothetical protein
MLGMEGFDPSLGGRVSLIRLLWRIYMSMSVSPAAF